MRVHSFTFHLLLFYHADLLFRRHVPLKEPFLTKIPQIRAEIRLEPSTEIRKFALRYTRALSTPARQKILRVSGLRFTWILSRVGKILVRSGG